LLAELAPNTAALALQPYWILFEFWARIKKYASSKVDENLATVDKFDVLTVNLVLSFKKDICPNRIYDYYLLSYDKKKCEVIFENYTIYYYEN
jgi:hypothetical protein